MAVKDKQIDQAKWDHFFSSRNRIEANYVASHPNYPAHDHTFIEIQMVVGGTCLQHTSHGTIRPVTGDVFLFRPGAWHSLKDVDGLNLYNCCFDSSLLAQELSWTVNHPLLGSLLWFVPLSPEQHSLVTLHLPSHELRRCRQLLDNLRRLANKNPAEAFADELGLLIQFLGVLGRHLPKEHIRSATSGRHPAVAQAIQLIEAHPAEQWTLSKLASRVHVEPTYFVRLFHKTVGVPPITYIAGRRAELAAALLRRTTAPVSEIGAIVGWPDPNHFSRRFRHKFGVSPTHYRQRFLSVVDDQHDSN